jgi:hypothetical protein
MTDHTTINLRFIETKSYRNNDTSKPKRIETMTQDVIVSFQKYLPTPPYLSPGNRFQPAQRKIPGYALENIGFE